MAKLYSNVLFYGAFATAKMLLRYLMFLTAKYGLRRKMLLRKIYDYSMYLSLDTGGISKVLYLRGKREEDHRIILCRELRSGDRVLDIGANIGYYAIMEAVIIGSGGKVFAVEPDRRNLELLRENVSLNRLNGIIDVYDIALSNESGMKQMAVHNESNLNVIISGNTPLPEGSYRYMMEIMTVDIYDFLIRIGKANLLRMDLEGHEIEILQGINRLACDHGDIIPDKILFESHPALYDDQDRNMRAQLDLLFNIGYRVKTIVSADERQANGIKTSGYSPSMLVRSDLFERGLYDDIRKEDALNLICGSDCVRTVLLARVTDQ